MSDTFALTTSRYASGVTRTVTIEQEFDHAPEEPQTALTPREVAARYNVSESLLSNWRSSLKGPKYTKTAGKITYKPDDVERFLAAPRIPGWMNKGLAQ